MKERIKSYIKWILRGEIPTEVLVKRGLKVGKNFNRQRNCTIDPPHCWLISIGDDVAFAPGVHILAHDGSMKKHIGYTKIGLVEIGNGVFIGADSVVLPNVKIGDNCMIGAGSVVSKDIPSNSVAVGNPARVIMTTDEYLNKNKRNLDECPVYDSTYTLNQNITEEQKSEMINSLRGTIGYIE